MKVAISVPDPVFAAAERLAAEMNVSRSQLYADALAAYLDTRCAAAITTKLNTLYGGAPAIVDEELMKAQLRSIGNEAW